MKNLKLFPKTFLYTLVLMAFIMAVALGTTYFLGTVPQGQTISVSIKPVMLTKAQPPQETAVPVGEEPSASQEAREADAPVPETNPQSSFLVDGESGKSGELSSGAEGESPSLIPLKESVSIINADTVVAIPAANLLPAVSATEGQSGAVAGAVSAYNMVRFGNLVGSTITKAIPVVVAVCLVLSVLCALLFSRMIAAPIRKISAATERMSALEPEALCPVTAGDEIGALAGHVNSLYSSLLSNIQSLEEEKRRVEESEKSKVDFLRSASHELKTPVTALSAMLENMMLGVGKYKDYSVYLPRCKEMTDRLSFMIRDILDASRAQSAGGEAVAVALAPFLAELCEPFEELAVAEGQRFTLDAAEGTVTLPPNSLAKALGNVLGNAAAYTPEGGAIAVRCDGGTLTVENQCTPIPEENLAHIFEAFYRPDWSRDRADGGNGLGLYITAGILRELSLDFAFAPMADGSGMVFTVVFPQNATPI